MSSQVQDGVVRTDGGTAGLNQWVSLGVATYLVAALGTTVTFFLVGVLLDALGPSMGGPGMGMGMMTPGSGGLAGAVGALYQRAQR